MMAKKHHHYSKNIIFARIQQTYFNIQYCTHIFTKFNIPYSTTIFIGKFTKGTK